MLQVQDTFGVTGTATTTATVTNVAPTAMFEAPESVGTPGTAQGPATGETSELLDFTTTGSLSSLGHPVEYRFDWGDGAVEFEHRLVQ